MRIVLAAILLQTSMAAAGERWFELDMQVTEIGWGLERVGPQKTGEALRAWIADTPPADIRDMLGREGNVETGVFDVLNKLSRSGAHAEALALAEALDARLADPSSHVKIAAVAAKLNLRLGRTETALVLAREARSVICPQRCDDALRDWLADGSLPATVRSPALVREVFDERARGCDSGFATDKLAEFDAIDLVEGAGGTRAAARVQLAAMWPDVVAGCTRWVDRERVQRLLDLGWSAQDLGEAFDAARGGIAAVSPQPIALLGTTLALPGRQCDFATDSQCHATVPLSGESARRIFDRLSALDAAFARGATGESADQEPMPSDQVRKAYEEEMSQAAALDADAGLARMRQILAKPAYRRLGAFLDSYSFGMGLEAWSRNGHADTALAVFRAALEIGGRPLRDDPETETGLALLLLRAGDKHGALDALQSRYDRAPNEATAKTIGALKAGLAGADLVASLPVRSTTRPWRYTGAIQICDFFSMHGLTQIDNVDLISAFHGERKAALWLLAQKWPGVVENCYDGMVWKSARERLLHALGATAFAAAQAAAPESIELGGDAHFEFAGERLPLPDTDARGSAPSSAGGEPIQRELVTRIIRDSGLLDSPGTRRAARGP